MIGAFSKTFRKPRALNLKYSQKYIANHSGLYSSRTFNNSLIHSPKFFILQDAKRLKTFFVPQEEEIKPIDKEIFNDAALTTLIKIQSGFQRIIDSEQNQVSKEKIQQIIKNDLYSLEVVSEKGSFQFKAMADLSTLFYTSPISGAYKYFYSIDDQKFLNNKDRHQLEENLTREVLDKLYFVLQF